MRYIENKDLREWVKDSLRKAIFQKAHALAVQTGCEILVKLEDIGDVGTDSQYYATNSLQQAYRQGSLCEKPGEVVIAGETGLPATQMVETAVQSCGDNLNCNNCNNDDDGRAYGYISSDTSNIRHVVPMSMSRGQTFVVPSTRHETLAGHTWSITQPISQPHMVTSAVAPQLQPENYIHDKPLQEPGDVGVKLEEEEEEDEEEVIIEESLEGAERAAEYHAAAQLVGSQEKIQEQAEMDGVERTDVDGGSAVVDTDMTGMEQVDGTQSDETKFMYQCVICRASFLHPSLIQEHVARAHMHLFEQHQQPSYQPVVVPDAESPEAAGKLVSSSVTSAASSESSLPQAVAAGAVMEQQDIPSTSRFAPEIKEPLVFYSTDESLMDAEPEQHASFITYPAPLPSFTKPISHALRSGNVHQAWSRFIREAASFYLPAMPIEDGKAKIVYQYIGRTMYETYPCIKSDGDKPWTYFNKCLSINIRRLRSKRRAKAEGSGKTVAKLMGTSPNS